MVLIQAIVWFVLIIGIVIFIHELGHFTAAKLIGVNVEEFAFGFGKKIFGKKIGETEYKINMLPIGGYVKLLGEEENVKDPRSFSFISLGKKAIIISAGVIMNIFLAIFFA